MEPTGFANSEKADAKDQPVSVEVNFHAVTGINLQTSHIPFIRHQPCFLLTATASNPISESALIVTKAMGHLGRFQFQRISRPGADREDATHYFVPAKWPTYAAICFCVNAAIDQRSGSNKTDA